MTSGVRIDIIEGFFAASCTAREVNYILKERHKIQLDALVHFKEGKVGCLLDYHSFENSPQAPQEKDIVLDLCL